MLFTCKAVFNLLLKVITRLQLLCSVIGLRISIRSFSSNEKQNQNQSHLVRAIFEQVTGNCSDWCIKLFAPPVIGRSNYFGGGFSTVIWKPLQASDLDFLSLMLKYTPEAKIRLQTLHGLYFNRAYCLAFVDGFVLSFRKDIERMSMQSTLQNPGRDAHSWELFVDSNLMAHVTSSVSLTYPWCKYNFKISVGNW